MGRIRRFLAALVLLSCAAPVTANAKPCSLVLGWEPYAVYTFIEHGSMLTGADIELLRAAAKEVGCTLSFKELGWHSILEGLQRGSIDVATSASRTPEREAFALFSIPYRRTEMAIYVRRGESGRHRLSGLAAIAESNFKLGTVAGYDYGPEFARLIEEPVFADRIRPAPDYRSGIKVLRQGWTDGFLADDVGVMVAEVRALEAEAEFERYPLSLAGQEVHFIFSRKSVDPKIVAAIDASLARMKADGRVREIIGRFLK